MTTTVIKTIGTGGDYTTWASWIAACPSNCTTSRAFTCTGSTSSTLILDAGASGTDNFYTGHAVSADARPTEKRLITNYVGSTKVATIGVLNGSSATWANNPTLEACTIEGTIWAGQGKNQEFTGSSPLLNITGITTNSSNYITVGCESGASFNANANKLTNALIYNASNGCGIRGSSGGSTAVVTIAACDYTVFDGLQIKCDSGVGLPSFTQTGTGPNVVIKNSIVQATPSSNQVMSLNGGLAVNCLIVNDSSAGGGIGDSGNASAYRNCTSAATASASGNAYSKNYDSPTVKNSSGFGFGGFAPGGGGSFSGSSDYNLTDKSTASGGAHDIKSKTFSNQFVSTTNDFRPKAGSDAINAGVRDQTYTNDLDILGQARSTTTPTIGCMEYIAAGGTTYNVDITEAATASESSSVTLTAAPAITEAATATEASGVTLVAAVSITEAATATEASSTTLTAAPSITEAATASDSSSATLVAVTSITEAASATDSSGIVSTYNLDIAEAASASDSVDAVVIPPSTKVGGDDKLPRRRSPHKGWDEAEDKKKRELEKELERTLLSTYRTLMGIPQLKERAEKVVKPFVYEGELPSVETIDWPAVTRDAEIELRMMAVAREQLIAEQERQRKRQMEEEEIPMLMQILGSIL